MSENIISLNDRARPFPRLWEHGPHYGGSEQPLATEWGAEHLGFHLESLDAGKFSCPYHLHRGEEELFLVLSGTAVVRQDGKFRRIHSGDLIFFPIGVLHHFYNPGPDPFVFFALSNRNSADICEYPDSGKTMHRSSKKIFLEGKEIEDYWAGEENPRDFWPAEWLLPQ